MPKNTKRWVWLFAAVLLAVPVYAQDDGGGGLPSSLFGTGDGGGFARGEQANPMEAVKKFLAQAKVTLSGDQEKALKPTIESTFKLVQDTVEKFSSQPGSAGQRGVRGQRGEDRGGFGGERGAAPANPQLAAELQKINNDILVKITAALKPDQQAAFKKWQNEEIKKGGGFAALKVVMEEAGAPFTPEQEPQVRALYLEDAQQRAQLMREFRGQPDQAKLGELELATMTKVAKLLMPVQRKALLDSRAKK